MVSQVYRQPRCAVTLNGTTVTGAMREADVHSNNYFAADTFRISLALAALPPQFGADFWSRSQSQIGISMDAGDGMKELILGNADVIDIELGANTVEASGRDLTAGFIDNKTSAKWQNHTSSQIIADIVSRHPEITSTNITATSRPAGTYYEIDHARLTSNVSEWTLMNYLAECEGFDLFVSGKTLSFVPSQQNTAPAFTIQYQHPTIQQQQAGNFMRLGLRRSQTLAKGVIVKVISWNSKRQTAFTPIAKRSGTSGTPTTDTAQVYVYRFPGLTQDESQQQANNLLEQISKHERDVDVSIPGETGLTPRQLVHLTGTGTSFDQDYFVDAIDRSFTQDEGFSQTIKLKNHSPQSGASIS